MGLNKKTYNLKTSINQFPEDIIKELNIDGYPSDEFCFYKTTRGWQIAMVSLGKNILIDCEEEKKLVHVIK